MADGDDLPDDDYASIYGHEALHARRMAQTTALLRHYDAMASQPVRQTPRAREEMSPLVERFTYGVMWSAQRQQYRAIAAEFPTLVAYGSWPESALTGLLRVIREYLTPR